ncbi:MAG: class I SAM-dependent methyltransferase [Clostridiales bacterium]|nr:class I SAM-dependent methyltransferase [Clostridiales bacterium]
MKRLSEVVKQKPAPRILDIGTGSGQFIHMIQESCNHYETIVGVDTHEKAIERAKESQNDPRVTYEIMDVYDYDKEPFDIVCLSNSLHHFEDPNKILELMVSLTKDDGYIIFNEMYQDFQNDKQMTHVGLHHFWASIDRIHGVIHKETYKKKEIIDILTAVPKTELLDSWNLEFEEEQTIGPEDYTMLKNSVTNSLKRIEGHERYGEYQKTGDILLNRIDEIGFESATQLMVVLKKS